MSSEAVRMFRAMAKEESNPESDKEPSKPFSSYVQAFLLATALGVVNESRKTPKEKKQWIIRGEYLSSTDGYRAIRQLLKSKLNLKTDREVISAMVEYAESGVRELYNEYSKTGDIDFLKISLLSQ